MKISNIKISNFVGIKSVDLPLESPVTLICGDNESGKSSIAEAIRIALTGEHNREHLKKNLARMVHRGQQSATVALETINGTGEIINLSVKLPNPGPLACHHPSLPFTLNPARFAEMDVTNRRALLFKLSGRAPTEPEVEQCLIERGCDKTLISEILPRLKQGFAVASAIADDSAKDERGAWRGVTGEVYGEIKAETWSAHVELCMASAEFNRIKSEKSAADDAVTQQTREIGRLEAMTDRLINLEELLNNEKIVADKLEDMEKAFAVMEEDYELKQVKLDKLAIEAGGTTPPYKYYCPDCGSEAMLEDGKLTHYEYDGKPPNAVAKLAFQKREVQMMKLGESLGADREKLRNAQAVTERIYLITKELKSLDRVDERLGNAKRDQADVMANANLMNQRFMAAQDQMHRMNSAITKNKLAAKHHQAAVAWDLIAKSLGPDGIPAELVAAAIGPINDCMRNSKLPRGLDAPYIDEGMEISLMGAPYHSLSESEQWRCDAILSVALAHITGLKTVLLDRFDILAPSRRPGLLVWLSRLAQAGQINTAIVLGTMKSVPPKLPPSVKGHWLENGAMTEEAK